MVRGARSGTRQPSRGARPAARDRSRSGTSDGWRAGLVLAARARTCRGSRAAHRGACRDAGRTGARGTGPGAHRHRGAAGRQGEAEDAAAAGARRSRSGGRSATSRRSPWPSKAPGGPTSSPDRTNGPSPPSRSTCGSSARRGSPSHQPGDARRRPARRRARPRRPGTRMLVGDPRLLQGVSKHPKRAPGVPLPGGLRAHRTQLRREPEALSRKPAAGARLGDHVEIGFEVQGMAMSLAGLGDAVALRLVAGIAADW